MSWFTPLGGFGVALFLFCSGYGLTCSYESSGLKNYWKKKIIGIYFIYALIELVTAIIFTRDIKTVVLDLLLIVPAHSYGWYMQYLFGCYLLFWLAFKLIKHKKARLITLFALYIFSFFVFENLRAEQAFSFVGGIFAATFINEKNSDFKYGKILAILALILSVGFLGVKQLPIVREQHHYIITLLNLLIKGLAAAGVIYLTYAFKFVNKISGLIFPFFGKISYVLYLIHGYLIFVVSDNIFGNYLLNSVVFIVASIVISFIIDFVTKKLTGLMYKTFRVR